MNSYNVASFAELANNYEAILFDIWGVVFDGVNPYPGAIERINDLIARGKKVLFLSNNPRPSEIAAGNLKKWGVNLSKAVVYTSGDAVREQLKSWDDQVFKSLGSTFYHLGKERNKDILSGLEVRVTENLEESNFLLITVYSDPDEDFDIYDDFLKKAISIGLPAVCANPDVFAPEGKGVRRCAGAFGKKYEAMGGRVHYYGKPDAKFFNKLIDKFLPDVPKDKILMVGDTLETDILGANRAGIDSVLLLTGNGKNYFESIVDRDGPVPTWISDGLY